MRIEIVISKHTLIDLVLVKAVVVIVVPNVLVISKRVKGAAVEWVPL